MSVAVVPGLLVSIRAAGRYELVENLGQVSGKTGLQLDAAHGGGAAYHEDVDYPGRDTGALDEPRYFRSEILDVTVTRGLH
jgi:hypothetical protein